MTQSNHYSYRPEIDGIRAFAVIAVIINHFNKDILPSGYLGVDVFFVVSGFVITSSLANRASENFRDFLIGFYTRRIKRLVPALVLFVLVTSFLISFFVTSPETLRTGLKSLFGLSNLYLLQMSTDYFAASTELNVFTHTWSLGVEEQFYFLFPFLVWITGFGRHTPKGSRNLFWVIGALSVASLVVFVYLYPESQSTAYFSMPTRLWELGTGCLLFLSLNYSKATVLTSLKKLPPLMIIGFMIAGLFTPIQFAVSATILIVVLTATLINCLHAGTNAYALFTHPQVVYVGLISYSLYLWHWGVLSLSRLTIGIHWWSIPIQIALIFLLSIASYQYVETPLRRAEWSVVRWRSIVYGLATISIASILLLILSRPVVQGYLYSGRINDMEKSYLNAKKPTLSIKTVCNIFNDGVRASSISDSCGFGNQASKPTIFLVGDSHIEQFADSIAKFAQINDYNFRAVWGNFCLFPASVVRQGAKNCFDLQSLVEQSLISKIKSGDVVFVGNALYARFSQNWGKRIGIIDSYLMPTGKSISKTDAASEYSRSLRSFAERIVARGAKIVIYLDSAQFPDLTSGLFCQKQWFRPVLISECIVDKNSYIAERDLLFGWVNDWADGKYRFAWDGIDETTCNKNQCIATHYNDSNHFKGYYADFIFNKFISDFKGRLFGGYSAWR